MWATSACVARSADRQQNLDVGARGQASGDAFDFDRLADAHLFRIAGKEEDLGVHFGGVRNHVQRPIAGDIADARVAAP